MPWQTPAVQTDKGNINESLGYPTHSDSFVAPSGADIPHQTLFESVDGLSYLSEPVIERLSDGRLLIVFRAGSSHVGNNGKLVATWSDDNGSTWSTPVTVVDSSNDDRNHTIAYKRSNAETLAVFYREYDDSSGSYVSTNRVVSDDGGESWGSSTSVDGQFSTDPTPFGPVVKTSNGLALSTYNGGQHEIAFLADDYTIDSINDGANQGREPVLVRFSDDRLWVILRPKDEAGYDIAQSTDGGQSWSIISEGGNLGRIDPLLQQNESVSVWAGVSNQILIVAFYSRGQDILGLAAVSARKAWQDFSILERASWQTVTNISGSTLDKGYPSFVTDDATGTHILTWYSDQDIEIVSTPAPTGGSYASEQMYLSPWDHATTKASDSVSVNADSWETIHLRTDFSQFSILGGMINGPACSAVRITHTDGSTRVIGSTGGQSWSGTDGAGDQIASMAIPPARRVKEIEFYNDSNSSETYGYQLTYNQ